MSNDTFQTYNSQVHEPVAPPSNHADAIDRTPRSADDRTTMPDRPTGTDTDEHTIFTDGGTSWTDLTAFERDLLETIATLDEEPSYGLTIEQRLGERYDELNGSHLYHHLDSLVYRGLLQKSDPTRGTALDRRTSEYRLTDRGYRLLERQARQLVTSCGIDSPTERGEH